MSEPQNDKYSFDQFTKFLENNFSLILIILIVFASGFLFGSLWKENKLLKDGKQVAQEEQQPNVPQGPSVEDLKKMPEVTADDYQRGAEDGQILIVEYSDYECPFCNKFHPTMQKIMDEYGDQVTWVYRHFPLDALHQNARTLAEMSECVAEYGSEDKFWEFSDEIYGQIEDNPEIAETENALDLVAEIGVNRNKVATCVENGDMADAVKEDASGGKQAGVTGTPGSIFWAEGEDPELIPGALPYETIKQKIENNL
jgi:protein-disulfide isomerase